MEIVVSMIAVVLALCCLMFIAFNEFKDYRQRLAEVRQGADESMSSNKHRRQ